MKLTKIAVNRPVTTIMMMLLVLIMGVVSFAGLKLDLMPNMNPPITAVITSYSGAGPEEVNEMVTKPIEGVVATTQGLKDIQSSSSSESSLIIAQYDWGTDMSEVRENLSTKLGRLPLGKDIDKPMIVNYDPTMMPILQFAISNGSDTRDLQQLVDDKISPELQNIEGVANITVAGDFTEEIDVNLNAEKLKEHGLNQDQIVQLIQGNNLTYPGGIVQDSEEKLNLRVMGEVNSINALKELPVSIVPGKDGVQVVTLKDVADVKQTKNSSSIARTDGKASLLVSVQKEGSANTAEVSNKVKEKIQSWENEYTNLNFAVASDQGEIIEKSVSNVSLSLLFGAFFAIFVILTFLRSAKSTLIIAIAIPFSVVTTFVLVYFSGMTLNIMSLGGLALGVGMLVDNAIVVIENINRHLAMNKSRLDAAIKGTSEVASAISTSTLTTVAVFLPVLFIGGIVGELFQELALTVTFSLLASLAVALTVIPTLAGLILKGNKIREAKENKLYQSVITWALSNRLAVLALTVIIFVSSLALLPQIGTEFIPAQDEGMFTMNVKLPEGTTMERTLEVVKKIETKANNVTDIDTFTATIGNDDSLNRAMNGSSENKASITFKAKENTDKVTKEIMEQLDGQLEDIKNKADITLAETNTMQALSGEQNSVEVLVQGKERTKVNEYASDLKKRLQDIDGISEVTDSNEIAKPEYQVVVNKDKAFQYGLTTYQVASDVNKLIQGQIATKISDDGVETNVKVKMAGINNSKEQIENLKISTPSGKKVALKEIGKVERNSSPVTIVRDNQNESVMVTASFEGTDMGTISSKIQSEISNMIDEQNIDTALYDMDVTGGAEMMQDSFDNLKMAMILAIIIVYMIMASQFESLIHPLIIMFTLPLAVTGVIGGLLVSGYSFGITAFIGIIILVGIVVNNAIVFIDYTNKLRKQGFAVADALLQAGTTRLRPIIMTALTTMLGLAPLAVGLGEGTEVQAPMAIAVIGGLFSSTILTLIVIPVVYSLVESIKGFRQKWKTVMEKFKEIDNQWA